MQCVECGKQIDGTAYQFGGSFACETCVRGFYVNAPLRVIELELWERARAAAALTRRRRPEPDFQSGDME
jgi:hypothetical protein